MSLSPIVLFALIIDRPSLVPLHWSSQRTIRTINLCDISSMLGFSLKTNKHGYLIWNLGILLLSVFTRSVSDRYNVYQRKSQSLSFLTYRPQESRKCYGHTSVMATLALTLHSKCRSKQQMQHLAELE